MPPWGTRIELVFHVSPLGGTNRVDPDRSGVPHVLLGGTDRVDPDRGGVPHGLGRGGPYNAPILT